MKITKYEHACVAIELDGKVLVIDPGVYAQSLPKLTNVAAIVVTHVHPDHFNPDHIKALLKDNPNAQIFSTAETVKELGEKSAKAVTGGDAAEVGPFKLQFYGDKHAIIHPSYPTNLNVGVMVNDTFYYPGDSFVQPDKPVAVLALPVNAPWMKMSETIDFVSEIKPTQAFATHNVFLSDEGMGLADRLMGFTETFGTKYHHLKPGESIEA